MIRLGKGFNAIPIVAALGKEVVVGIDEESAVICLSNFRFVMFFLLRSPKFCECRRAFPM